MLGFLPHKCLEFYLFSLLPPSLTLGQALLDAEKLVEAKEVGAITRAVR